MSVSLLLPQRWVGFLPGLPTRCLTSPVPPSCLWGEANKRLTRVPGWLLIGLAWGSAPPGVRPVPMEWVPCLARPVAAPAPVPGVKGVERVWRCSPRGRRMPGLSSLLPQGLPTRSLWETPGHTAWNPLWGRRDLEGQEPGSEPWPEGGPREEEGGRGSGVLTRRTQPSELGAGFGPWCEWGPAWGSVRRGGRAAGVTGPQAPSSPGSRGPHGPGETWVLPPSCREAVPHSQEVVSVLPGLVQLLG